MSGIAPAVIDDEHSVLLWQVCAFADDLGEAASGRGRLTPAYDALVEFLHYRLLPYLDREERELALAPMNDTGLLRILAGDHERLRADVDDLEASRTKHRLTSSATTLVARLERHAGREETWLAGLALASPAADLPGWAFPLLLGDVIDVDALPMNDRVALLRQRLLWMRAGDVVRLESRSDLHELWWWQHARDPGGQVWVYELDGPDRWRVRVTRSAADED